MSISCRRCQSRKIRCNRVAPRCQKCEAFGAECIYVPRKPRNKKQDNDIDQNSVLSEVLRRLKRLEEHCKLDESSDVNEDGGSPMSVSSVDSDTDKPVSSDKSDAPTMPGVIHGVLSRIQDPKSRSLLFTDVFCHLRSVESCFFDNERCVGAIAAAMSEIEHLQNGAAEGPPEMSDLPKDSSKNVIQNYYDCYQFEGFKIPLEKSFLLSIPDLLENPHVQLDCTSQIIYHTVRLQGMVLDPSFNKDDGSQIRHLYGKCLDLSTLWLENIQNTYADLFVAISMALEACDSEVAWKMLGHACAIAKALGYFFVDGNPEDTDDQSPLAQGSTIDESETEKNRKRFEFWHLLRTDCLFRLSFGKPTLIPTGSWKVNFPDPTINGIDYEASRFVQIHFLASMRHALVVMKYLDWMDSGPNLDPVLHDATIDSFLQEVQLIMSDWNAVRYSPQKFVAYADMEKDELFRMAKTQVDTWFCVDMVFTSYKFLIVLHQSKRCDRDKDRLSHQTIDIARKSIQMFQFLMGTSSHACWGLSLILLQQFIPFLIICLSIIRNSEPSDIETDLTSVTWIYDYVENIVKNRTELRPVMIIMKAIIVACHQSRSYQLESSMSGNAGAE
ncbi:uncharacterized protein N7511_007827 [Penicillium nucicola]|uniref:uncharacterized protein n=1 Tax=Penicillium nucicola TaxID=1850975 RepID=UPI002545256A|nr:uncharacterized protein N7511_007827 [Penicillium nucicola]KAJ5753674.1 hypothetical protein N7511_007827 [Penicillium nucicola]